MNKSTVLLIFAAALILSLPAGAGITVDTVDHAVNANCQTFGNEGFIDLVDQSTHETVGPFNESFLFDCSQTGCGIIGNDGPFVCEANSTFSSTVTPDFYSASVNVDLVVPEPGAPCENACGPSGAGIYEAFFTTDQDYRLLLGGSTTSSEMRLSRITPFADTYAYHSMFDDGPIGYDGVVTPGTFRIHATTSPEVGSFDFTLQVLDVGNIGPPPVPDGATVAGAPLTVSKAGINYEIAWTPTACSGGEVNVYFGTIGDYTQFTTGDCGRPSTGSLALGIPDNSWFLVVNTDGGGIDGSYSRDGQGNELNYGVASSVCPAIVSSQPAGVCP